MLCYNHLLMESYIEQIHIINRHWSSWWLRWSKYMHFKATIGHLLDVMLYSFSQVFFSILSSCSNVRKNIQLINKWDLMGRK